MSDAPSAPDKEGPKLGDTLQEVQGIFPSDVALQDGISRLTMAGFDRADISIPDAAPPPGEATPDLGAENPFTDDDNRQQRTLHSSMAGSAGALLAAGIVVATGGAAAPAIAAAAAAGLAAGGVAHGASHLADNAQHEAREHAAARGELVLAVRATDTESCRKAEAAMRDAGASRVETVTRVHNEISSAGWTG